MKKLLATLAMLALLAGFATPAGCLIGYVNHQTIMIYDRIVPGDEVEIRALFDGQETEYHIVLNRPGGRAFTGLSIVNHIADLKESGAKITTEVSGTAMSAAAIIWLMGDVRIAHPHDIIMFHGAIMTTPDGRRIPPELIDGNDKMVIDTINQAMYERIAEITDEKTAKKAIEEDLYITGREAFRMGFATTLK